MDLTFGPEDTRFREELRAWLGANLDAEWQSPGYWQRMDYDEGFEIRRNWERDKADAGWAGIDIPAEYGGHGGTAMQKAIYEEEMARAYAPQSVNRIGLKYLAPTLMVLGTEEQRRAVLPRMLRCDDIWCQGFSEPGAGSDLAGVRTRAVREGDDFVISGQKVWTTQGVKADKMFTLVRSDPGSSRHKGLTFILIDLTLPGVEVRPLRQITGENEFGEVFLDDVRVPVSQVVGEIGQGWKVAMTLLSFERGGLPFAAYETYRQELDEITAVSRTLLRNGRPAVEDPALRQKIAHSYIELELLRLHGLHIATRVERGERIGMEASLTKLHWSEAHQDVGELYFDVASALGQTDESSYAHLLKAALWSRSETIFGGTSQIQRNVVAERVLGLPR